MAKSFRDLCSAASTANEMRHLVAQRDPLSLSPTDIAIINRNAKRVEMAPSFRIAYAGTHSMEPLPSYFRAHAVGLGIGVSDYQAPYGQYMQDLLTDDSGLHKFQPDLLFISCALRQIAPRIHQEFGALSGAELNSERKAILDHLEEVANLASERLNTSVLLGNFPRPPWPSLGVADAKAKHGEAEFYLTLNLELLRRFKDSDRVHVLDLDRLVGGVRETSAEKMYFLAKSLWTDWQCNAIAHEMMRYTVAVTARTRKCLVVDLDNTLWGGVAGEDGPDGIQIGPGSPAAEAFESFQYAVRALRARGIMLAICSKNNPADVEAVFSRSEPMPLTLKDFSTRHINWDDKGSGLLNVAADLNIGVDSIVFADDNPAERAIVRGSVPAAEVLELPPDPADYAEFMRRQVWFEKLRISADDVARLDHYAVAQRRERLRTDASNLEQYLQELGTEVRVRPARAADVTRIHELFNKTNQFNLTTRRYTLADVERFLAAPEYILGMATASDNFGAMGTIAVYLVEATRGVARLDSFLMSCRALGRGIETAVMNCLKREVHEGLGLQMIDAEFIKTAKNAPAKDFLSQESFSLVEQGADGTQHYRLQGGGFEARPCPHLNVIHEFDRESSKV